jgi:hypothetical protein
VYFDIDSGIVGLAVGGNLGVDDTDYDYLDTLTIPSSFIYFLCNCIPGLISEKVHVCVSSSYLDVL